MTAIISFGSDLLSLFRMILPIPIFSEGGWFNLIMLLIGGYVSHKIITKYNENKSRQLLNSLPGIWTSLGLLGTFMSICISLGDISTSESIVKEGKTLGEIASLGGINQIDIKNIISELIPAFSTSIIGLIAALICTYKAKIRYAKEDAALNIQVRNKTPEEYIMDILDNIKMQSSETRAYNEKLNETLVNQSAILKKFVDDFVLKMNEIFDGMGTSIRKNIQDFGEQQFKNSAVVLEEVVKKMSEVSNNLMNQQTESSQSMIKNTNQKIDEMSKSFISEIGSFKKGTVEALTSAIIDQKTKFDEISKSVTENIATLSKGTTDVMSSMISSQETKINEISESFTGNIDHVNKKTLAAISEMTKSQNAKFDAIYEQSVSSMNKITDTQEQKLNTIVNKHDEFTKQILNESVSSNKIIANDIKESLTALTTTLQTSIEKQCNNLSAAILQSTAELKTNYDYISNHIAELRTNYEQSTLAYTDAVQNAHDLNESFEHTISSLDKSLDALDKTNANVSDITEEVRQRYERSEQLIANINEMATAIDTLQKLESQLNKLNNKAA